MMMTREVPWPGNQINDINQFRNECYKKCHELNPTDSGWYEKVNECGQKCKYALKEYEYSQGKNPCELKLQAPVFWFTNNHKNTYESYDYKENDDDDKSSSSINNKNTNIFYMTLYIILIIICCISVLIYII